MTDKEVKASNTLQMYQLAGSKVFLLAGSRHLRLSGGGQVSYSVVRQDIADLRFPGSDIPIGADLAPAKTRQWANLYQVGVPFELEWAIYRRFWISGEALYSIYGYRDAGRGQFRIRLELEPYLSFGLHF